MSWMSPTKIKTDPLIANQIELCSNATSALSGIVVPVEVGKDLVVVIHNAGAADYGGATYAITATNTKKVANWFSSSAYCGHTAAEISGNVVSLRAGETRFIFGAAALEAAQAISVTIYFTGTGASPLYGYAHWIPTTNTDLITRTAATTGIVAGRAMLRTTTHVVVSMSYSVAGGGSVSVDLYPRSAGPNVATLPVECRELGTGVLTNGIALSGAGTREFILPRPPEMDRLQALVTVAGSGSHVLVTCRQIVGGEEVMRPAPYYDANRIAVEYVHTVSRWASRDNWIAYLIGNALTVSNGVTARLVDITTLPGWIAGDTIGAMGFIPFAYGYNVLPHRPSAMRLCFFTHKGNTYHNYPAINAGDTSASTWSMVDFDLGAVYEPVYRTADNVFVSSARIPSTNAALTAEEQKTLRYDPGLPEWNYQQHTSAIGGAKADATPYGGGGLPAVLDKSGMKLIRIVHPFAFGTSPQDAAYPYSMAGNLSSPFSVLSKGAVFVPYSSGSGKNVILGTADGGRIWVVLHELGGNTASAWQGNNYDLTAIGAYVSGALSIVRRTFTNPSAATKEPAFAFAYDAPLSVTSIATAGGKAVVTTGAAHGFTTGDLICFKLVSAGNYSYLENTVTSGQAGAFASNSAGNGRFYRAKVTAPTTFELLQNYSGVDEKIGAHHMHSGNAAKDGVLVATGETYPSGWLLYEPIRAADSFEYWDPYTHRIAYPNVIRLNSSATSMQRAVGAHLTDDAAQTLLVASDEATISRGAFAAIPGRTANQLPARTSSGVMRVSAINVDDITAAEVVCEADETLLGLVVSQGLCLAMGVQRFLYASADGGDTWVRVPMQTPSIVGEQPGCVYVISNSAVYRVRAVP